MVGRANISRRADAVRHLFMALEKAAEKINTCWFCGLPLTTIKLANQGYLAGNHSETCPFEALAVATENCIKLRDSDDRSEKASSEALLAEKVSLLLQAMEGRQCPFPVCNYTSGHRLECPFHAFERDAGG